MISCRKMLSHYLLLLLWKFFTANCENSADGMIVLTAIWASIRCIPFLHLYRRDSNLKWIVFEWLVFVASYCIGHCSTSSITDNVPESEQLSNAYAVGQYSTTEAGNAWPHGPVTTGLIPRDTGTFAPLPLRSCPDISLRTSSGPLGKIQLPLCGVLSLAIYERWDCSV